MGRLGEIVDWACARRGAALMAVVNTTPDSFYDGGRHATPQEVRARIDCCVAEGADVIDVGAESTRPGAEPVAAAEQWERSHFAIVHAVQSGLVVSVDTMSPEMAERALSAGARVINDVSCLSDPDLAKVAARANADLVLMHSRGNMNAMSGFSQYDPRAYDDVVADVIGEWSQARDRAERAGLSKERIWFDPGFGFHKSAAHSAELLRRFEEFRALGKLLVVGTSRKSFLGALDDSPPDERLGATIASCMLAVRGGARMVRVHDVAEVGQALLAMRTLGSSWWNQEADGA